MYKLLDGKKLSDQIQQQIKNEIEQIQKASGKIPHLAIVWVENEGASETYVNNKIKACNKAALRSTLLKFRKDISEKQLIEEIKKLNENPEVDGIIVQLPLPKHIDEQKIIELIDPAKDVDGFHPVNIGKMMLGLPCFISATPYGIIQLIEHYQINTQGKHCVVIGRSHIVGTPISILLSRNSTTGNATVTLCHSKTQDIKKYTLQADIIISAVGKPNTLTADMVKEGAVVIDVGTTRVKDENSLSGYKLLGDVNFDEVSVKCSYITPVPGGVGPMTIAALLKNTLRAAKMKEM